MVRKAGVVFGAIFVALIFGLPLLGLDVLTDSDFLIFFARELSLVIMLTILALNVAATTFLLGNLIPLEEKFNKRFSGTRNELKQNIYFMTALTALNFLCVSSTGKAAFHAGTISGQTLLGYLSAVLTILVVMAMLEIVGVIFALDGTKKT